MGMEELDAIDALIIRAFGRHEQITHFTVCDTTATQSPAPAIMLTPIVFNIEVNENCDKMRVTSKSGVFLNSSGGLCNLNSQMEVREEPTNNVVGIINNQNLISTQGASRRSLVWDEPLNTINFGTRRITISMVVNVGTADNRCGKALAVAGVVMRKATDSSLLLGFQRSPSSALEKALMMMGAMRIYYLIHGFHRHPLPSAILKLMPVAAPKPPSLDILENVNTVIIRNSCRTFRGECILEILHAETHRIELLSEFTSQSGPECPAQLVRDTFGAVQFYTMLVDNSTTEVFSCIGNLVGSIIRNGAQTSFIHCNKVVMSGISSMCSNDAGIHSSKYDIKLCKSGNPVASADLIRPQTNTILLEMDPELCVDYKALIITYTTWRARFYHKIGHGVNPPYFTDYPYRRQLGKYCIL